MRRAILLLLLAAFLPMAILAGVLGVVALRHENAAIEQEALDRVRRLAAVIGRELTSQIDQLRLIAEWRELDGPVDEAGFVALARRVTGKFPAWRTVRVTDPHGNRIIDFPPTPAGTPSQVIDLASHRKAVETMQPVVGRVLRGPRDRPAFAIRAPVIRDNAVKYVVSVILEPQAIRDLLFASGVPPAWVATVIDGDGYVAARTAGPATLLAEPASDAAREVREHAEGGIYAGYTLEHLPTLSAFQKVGVGGWSVHIGVPRELALAPLRRSLWLIGTGGASALALVIAFVWLLLREIRLRRFEERRLERILRLEALGRMTGGVAHDFNNLLMIIQGSAEAIKRRRGDPEKQDSLADGILAAARRGAALTQQLLAFARRDTHKPVSFALQERAPELEALLRRSVRDDVQVTLSIAAHTWAVRADPNALEVALINLCVNASDAMPQGGAVVVVAKNSTVSHSGKSGAALDGDYVEISVRDAGVGIPAENLAQIFDPFFTTKPPGKGTGLGLSQVYGFAQQAGGSVAVESKVGEGSLFTLYLPRAQELSAAPQAPVHAEPHGGRRRVLLVEDDEQVAEVSAAMLADAGYRVTRATSVEAALALIDGAQPFDAVLSDVALESGASGLELARRLEQDWPDLPVILMTGYSDALAQANGSDYPLLLKPFGQAELAAALAAAIAGSLAKDTGAASAA